MARSIEEVLADVPAHRRVQIETRAAELIEEVDGLKAVRRLAGKTQAQIAATLGKKQPSVQKMESQADLYVSTLRRFVEAAGGTVEIRVTLPGRAAVKLTAFSELAERA
ncbi:MAG TPA: XRE family transcriptional regulator [Caulobacteraceae bacterium]|nr:XRE family transcriptional regulator [Caulobacteraceae bacterium]